MTNWGQKWRLRVAAESPLLKGGKEDITGARNATGII